MKPGNLALLIVLCIAIFSVTKISSQSSVTPQAEKSDAMPDFSYTDIYGQEGKLSLLEGPAVVHFWATWCAPCREEMPALMQKVEQNPETHFILVANDSDKDKVMAFMAPYQQSLKNPNIVLFLDKNSQVTDSFKVSAFPESFILRADKTLKQWFKGAVNWESLEIAAK